MPYISVVIPTAGRPAFLRRAIASCLEGEFSKDIEIIVIPNGPDMSWKQVRAELDDDDRIIFHYQSTADQNNARNRGIELATGELLRFLDDDDYLFPEAADRQYLLMAREQLDFCSGNALCIDQEGVLLGEIRQPRTDSAIIAAVSRDRLQLPFVHVYRRDSIGELRWPVGLRQSEDIVWLIQYVGAMPRRWRSFDAEVGAWYQHPGIRQSLNRPAGFVHEATARALLDAHCSLRNQNRWTAGVASVMAEALLELSHRAFPFRPIYWTNIIGQALKLDCAARPSAALYHYPGLNKLDPRWLLWLVMPKRLVSLAFGMARGALLGRNYRRTL